MDELENIETEQVANEEVAETDEYGLEEDDFLASLEELDREEQEEQREKNRNAEEARKRRERQAKEKAEQEQAEDVSKGGDESEVDTESKDDDIRKQFEEFAEKYPDVGLTGLKEDKDFNEYIDGKWEKGGKTLTELYGAYVDFRTRLSHNERRTATPSLKGSSSASVGSDEYFTQEELAQIKAKMPYMNSKQYNAIAEKYKNSVKYHKGE